jgi:hypothetical protein
VQARGPAGRLGQRPGEAEQPVRGQEMRFQHGREAMRAQALLDEKPVDRRTEVARQAGELMDLLHLERAAIEVAEMMELRVQQIVQHTVGAAGSDVADAVGRANGPALPDLRSGQKVSRIDQLGMEIDTARISRTRKVTERVMISTIALRQPVAVRVQNVDGLVSRHPRH